MKNDLSGRFVSFATFVWVTVAIGPWYVGGLIFLGAMCLALAVALAQKKP